ncbi:MAG: hypothetical protein GPOALKHO_000305 [Sodalis sp.]|nr:MAG: hypothetical protein GPOALKHO_000305 [Sodalis sp.]
MVTNSQRYHDKVSQMISWGHWFTLLNILLSLGLGSRYLFIADWPGSLVGRLYAFASWLGHFSFLGFTLYLLVVFPITFVVMPQRLLRFLSAIIATAGLTLLLVDTEVFIRFHQHFNHIVWGLVTDQTKSARDWQFVFIDIPVIFLVEILFGTWSWQKLRRLNHYRIGKPIALCLSPLFAPRMWLIFGPMRIFTAPSQCSAPIFRYSIRPGLRAVSGPAGQPGSGGGRVFLESNKL